MKSTIIALLLLLSASSWSQETEFKFSKDGLTDFVVGTFDTNTKNLYAWTLAWAKENKTNKIISQVENEKITFQGTKDNFLCSKAGGTNICNGTTYTIEITIKEGKYKFDVTELVTYDKKQTITKVDLNNFSQFYDKDGNLKKYSTEVPAAYEGLFNGLNKNLLTFLDKKKKAENW